MPKSKAASDPSASETLNPSTLGPLRMKHHGRFWAVHEGAELICLAAYKKGAARLISRLQALATGGTTITKGDFAMDGLISHVDSSRVSRAALVALPTPEPTATHVPIPHHRLVTVLHETLVMRRLAVLQEEYAVTEDGNRFFGVMTLETEEHGVRFSIGLRNSHDKTIAVGLVAGYRVVVCDNMAFFGQGVRIARKHTRRLELEDTMALAVEKIQRSFEPMRKQIEAFRATPITDPEAKLVIYEAFVERALDVPKSLAPKVHDYYFEPRQPEFESRTLWSLSNAFTSAFQELDPIPRFGATAKLTEFFEDAAARAMGPCEEPGPHDQHGEASCPF